MVRHYAKRINDVGSNPAEGKTKYVHKKFYSHTVGLNVPMFI